jgi:hypothetical protein
MDNIGVKVPPYGIALPILALVSVSHSLLIGTKDVITGIAVISDYLCKQVLASAVYHISAKRPVISAELRFPKKPSTGGWSIFWFRCSKHASQLATSTVFAQILNIAPLQYLSLETGLRELVTTVPCTK